MYKEKKYILFLLLLIVSILTGCSQDKDPVRLVDTTDQIQGLSNPSTHGALADAFREKVVYEVTEISQTDGCDIATVKVMTPDLGKIIPDAIRTTIESNETEDYDTLLDQTKVAIQSILYSGNYPVLERTIEMDAEKTEDDYSLISNDEFEKMISGNLEEVFFQMIMEGLADEDSN